MCNKPCLRRRVCNRCNSLHFCSYNCQIADHPVHTLICSQLSSADDQPRLPQQGIIYRRAFYFPDDFKYPQLVWVPCTVSCEPEETEEEEYEDPCLAFLRRYVGSHTWKLSVSRNCIRRRQCEGVFQGHYRDGYEGDGSVVNQSILHAIGKAESNISPQSQSIAQFKQHLKSKEKAQLNYSEKREIVMRGPFLFLKFESFLKQRRYQDVEAKDFRDLVDWLRWYVDRSLAPGTEGGGVDYGVARRAGVNFD